MAVESRLPPWFKIRLPTGERHHSYTRLKNLMRANQLHTICEEARCPNIAECWGNGTATFLILGDICTRACSYCAVKSGRPGAIDPGEPLKLAQSVRTMQLRHVVITSVNRDDLSDGGAAVFADCVEQCRNHVPGIRVELLIPDFLGERGPLQTVIDAGPDILNHNIETVPRLFPKVRHKGDYALSIDLLRHAKKTAPHLITKSGMMVGFGESDDEVVAVMRDLHDAKVDVLTLGQYLRPSKKHVPVDRFYTPAEFARFRETAKEIGFTHVESGPLVRSSYHAHEQVA